MPEQTTPEELHIASFVVHCRPAQMAGVTDFLADSQRLELGTESPQGKLVVLAEGSDQQALLEAMEAIESLPGVLECILVYHEVMSATEAGQQLIA